MDAVTKGHHHQCACAKWNKGPRLQCMPYSHIYSLLPVCMLSGYDLALFFPSP